MGVMKHGRLFSAVIAIGVIFGNQALADRVVTFPGDPWPPYVEGVLGEDASSGIAVGVVNEIFSHIKNVHARFPLIPWNRALGEVKAGSQDGIAMLLKTPEREAFMVYSVPMIVSSSLVWSTADNAFEWDIVKDFHGLRVGIIDGYSYGDELDADFKSGKVVAVKLPTVERMFAMLANNRIDLALASEAVGTALAKKFPQAGIRAAKRATDSETFYLAISKKSPAIGLIPQINQIILQLQATGVIDRIIRNE